MTPDEVEAELRTLIGDEGHFPTQEAIKAIPGLRNAIQRTGGSSHWAEKLGVAPPGRRSQELTVDQIEERLRRHVERLGRFPRDLEMGLGLMRGIARTGGVAAWAERLGIRAPRTALSKETHAQLHGVKEAQAKRRDAVEWRPPEVLPDDAQQLAALIATVGQIVEELRAYRRDTVTRLEELRAPQATQPQPGRTGAIDRRQGQAGRQVEAQRREENRRSLLLELGDRAEMLATRIRDAESIRNEAADKLRTLGGEPSEPSREQGLKSGRPAGPGSSTQDPDIPAAAPEHRSREGEVIGNPHDPSQGPSSADPPGDVRAPDPLERRPADPPSADGPGSNALDAILGDEHDRAQGGLPDWQLDDLGGASDPFQGPAGPTNPEHGPGHPGSLI